MDTNFWHQRWEANIIGFHESKVNPLLVRYFDQLAIETGKRVFVPLCGKTISIAWLLSKGYKIVGAELSELAVQQLFIELGIEPKIKNIGDIKHYSSRDIDIFVGDIFMLTHEMLGSVDAVYDRAALIALPENIRGRYTKHIIHITDSAKQLLITIEFDQKLSEPPPFAVSKDEVNQHYNTNYDVSLLKSVDIVGGLKGECPAKETVWLLTPVSE